MQKPQQRKQNKNSSHMIDLLFVIALFGVFAVTALFLITMGSNIYKNTVNSMNENFQARTSFAYLTQKIHQNDESQAVSIGNFHQCPALILSKTVDNTIYNTYLYEYDGYLKELLVKDGNDISEAAGQNILPITSFQVSMSGNNMIKCNIETLNHKTYSINIALRSSMEVSNEKN